MNAHMPVHAPDPWADIDREDDAILDRYLCGEHDEQRAAAFERIRAMIDALPPKPEPTAEELQAARQRSDDALRGLAEDYLSLLDKGLRTFARQERRAIRGGHQ